jgi:hypothetical protein
VAEDLDRDTEAGAPGAVAEELDLDTEVGAPGTVTEELDRDTEVGAFRTVAVELDRDTLPCGLAKEFALETGDAIPLALSEGKIVAAPATDWGIVTIVLVLDKAFVVGVVVWALVMELVRDREIKEDESLYFDDLVDAEEAMEGVLSTFAGRDPAVRTVETESDLDIETVDDLGLEDLMLGSGSSR